MAFESEERPWQVVTPEGKSVFHVGGLRGSEGISRLYRFELDLFSENGEIDFSKIIGQHLCVKSGASDGSARVFSGVVSRFSQQSAGRHLVAYRAELVPWLWLLTRSTNCRIFQDKSIPDIVKEVLSGPGGSDFEVDLAGSYEPLPYCVQYRETDFDFVSRLLEDAGISYYFRHEEKQHVLVLFDSPSKNQPCPGNDTASYVAEEGGEEAAGQIGEWLAGQELRTGGVALRDYSFSDPSLDLGVDTKTRITVGGNDRFQKYDYPGEYESLDRGNAIVKLRMEAEEAAAQEIRGSGNCANFAPGYRFTLSGHYRKSFNATYLVTSIEHEMRQGIASDEAAAAEYDNRFTCIPHSVPYRPLLRTPRPRIHGAQTAIVTGSEGEEVDVDEHGRVVVQFHWDRQGKNDEKSSCRVRVAQTWAGKGWGAVFHPRIGQEVIVEFLEGDPNRPIITGRVYNGEQTPPYALPANKTQSGFKSRSSKDAAATNFNEIRLEDKKGAEQISIQAEKDFQRLVKNDEADEVQHDRSRQVGNDESIAIRHDRTIRVDHDLRETIKHDETLAVGNDRKRDVSKNETVQIGADQKISVGDDRTLTVGKNQTIDVTGNQGESIGGAYKTEVKKDYTLEAKKITFEAADEIVIQVGKAKLVMKKNGDVTLDGKKISIKASGDLVLKGSKIAEN